MRRRVKGKRNNGKRKNKPQPPTCLITINTNSYDTVIPKPPLRHVDCFYMSNDPHTLEQCRHHGWTPIELPCHPDGKLLSRLAKTMPQLFLPDTYSRIIYTDANRTPKEKDVNRLLAAKRSAGIMRVPHPVRPTLAEDKAFVLSRQLETPDSVDHVCQTIYARGFKDQNGHSNCARSIRIHPWEACMLKAGGTWWRGVHMCRRDQMSFDYSVWKHSVPLFTLPDRAWTTVHLHTQEGQTLRLTLLPSRPAYKIQHVYTCDTGTWISTPNLEVEWSYAFPDTDFSQMLEHGWCLSICVSEEAVLQVIKKRPDSLVILITTAPVSKEILSQNLVDGIISRGTRQPKVPHYMGLIANASEPSEIRSAVETMMTAFEAQPI